MIIRRAMVAAVCGLGMWAASSVARAADDDALDLKVQEEPAAKGKADKPIRLFGELAAGRMSQRYGLPSVDTRRASIDFNWSLKLTPQWRVVLSDRLDDVHPVEAGGRSTLNSLREAFVGWQSDDARQAIEGGRINVRYGPAYGFNPTDYFRDGASRAVTSADPLALRENRLGTAMVRGQQLWAGGGLSVAFAPELEDQPSRGSRSLDLGSTNHTDRALVALSSQLGDNASIQAFAFHDRRKGTQLGANGSALISDAAVGFFEWSGGRDATLVSESQSAARKLIKGHRAVLGMTYTTPSRLALTVEAEYNGFAMSRAESREIAVTGRPEVLGAYLYHVQRRQDIASRRAMMFYASQRDVFLKNLELKGLLRHSLDDRSRFAWVEARYHWPSVDVALQWQANIGKANTEYGVVQGKRLLQLVVAYYY